MKRKNKNLVLTRSGQKIYVDIETMRKMQQMKTIICVLEYADDAA